MATKFRASILMADYLAVDASQKITAVGLGWSVAGIDVQTGHSPPMSIGLVIDVPPDMLNREFPVSLDLRTAAGEVVQVPSVSGSLDALRIQQLVKAGPLQGGPFYLPDGLPGRVQTIIAFQNGIPLAAGQSYYWRLEVDHTHLKAWEVHFHIAGPPPGPVVGGPVGSADIPDLMLPGNAADEDDEEETST